MVPIGRNICYPSYHSFTKVLYCGQIKSARHFSVGPISHFTQELVSSPTVRLNPLWKP